VPAAPASARALSIGRAGLAFTLTLAIGTESTAMTVRTGVAGIAVMPAIAIAGTVAVATTAAELL